MKHRSLSMLTVVALLGCRMLGPEDPNISRETYIQRPMPAPDEGDWLPPIDSGLKKFDDATRTTHPDAAVGHAADASLPHEPGVEEDEPSVQFCDWKEYHNLVMNGTFEYQPINECGWSTFDAAYWGVNAEPSCEAEDHEGCSEYLGTMVWGNAWAALLFQDIYTHPFTQYRLSFEAKAAGAPRSIEVALLGAGDIENLGDAVAFELGTTWQTHELVFATQDWEDSSTLIFAFGNAPNGFYLDNVWVSETD